jgi:hypothetical protein
MLNSMEIRGYKQVLGRDFKRSGTISWARIEFCINRVAFYDDYFLWLYNFVFI